MRETKEPYACTYGSRLFNSLKDAEGFQNQIYGSYPPMGYMTTTELAATDEGFRVFWKIYSSD